MTFRTWSSGGGRRILRPAVVVGMVVAILLVLATAGLAWFAGVGPPGTWGPGVEEPAAPGSDPPDDGDVEVERTGPRADPVWHCPVADGRAQFRDDYGYRKPSGRIHRGVDLYAVLGTPVVAPEPGRVERSESGIGGKRVTLHTDGRRYLALHLSRFGAAGQVEAGETIGYVGTTGNARGSTPHLHFEIRGSDGPIDPYPLLDEHCR